MNRSSKSPHAQARRPGFAGVRLPTHSPLAVSAACLVETAVCVASPGRSIVSVSDPLNPGLVNCKRHRSEEHTSELQSLRHLVCRLLLVMRRLPPRSTLFPYTTLFRSQSVSLPLVAASFRCRTP